MTTNKQTSPEKNISILPYGMILSDLIYPLATLSLFMAPALFPPPPYILYTIVTRFSILQWIFVFILVWQGGGKQDTFFSIGITFSAFILTSLLNLIFPAAM